MSPQMQNAMSSTATPGERRREHIDQQIIMLKTERNQLAPVSRLPPEVMSNIFSYVKTAESRFIQTSMDPLRWIQVTHVSAKWMAIALNSPTLWANIPLKNPCWTTEMIKRSKLAGLSITVNFPTQSSRIDAALMDVLEHSSRFKHLSLSSSRSSRALIGLQTFMEMLPTSLPQLETLHIRGPSPHENEAIQDILVPPGLLTGTPRLYGVELEYCLPSWAHAPHILESLTYLSLMSPISAPTLVQFMDLMRALINLQDLEIEDSLPVIGPHDQVCILRPLCLEKLRTLHVYTRSSSLADTEAFFRHVRFPASAIVDVSCIISHREVAHTTNVIVDASALLEGIAHSYSNCSPDLYFRTVSIERTVKARNIVGANIHLYRKTYDDSPCMISFLEPHCLTLYFEWPYIQGQYEKVLTDVLSCGLPLKEVSRLYLIDSTNAITPETLARTLGLLLPKLSCVNTAGFIGSVLLAALQLPTNTASTGSEDNLCFPNISTLYLSDLLFFDDSPTEISSCYDMTVDLLEDCLIQRYECGAKIVKLVLKNCYRLNESSVKRLGNIVVDVCWDEVEQGFSDSVEETDEERDEDDYSEYDSHVGYGDSMDEEGLEADSGDDGFSDDG